MTTTSTTRTRRPVRTGLLFTAVSAIALGVGVAGAAGATAAEVPAAVIETAPTPAGTSPADEFAGGDMTVASSRGFDVRNFSDYTLRLKSVHGDNLFEGRPDNGSEIKPGGSQRFEVLYKWLSDQRDNANYDVLDDSGTVVGTFTAKMGVLGYEGWGGAKRFTDATTDAGTTTHDGENITFLNAAGTRRTITDGQAQAQVLQRWCTDSAATCSFTTTDEEHYFTPAHQVGKAYGNATSGTIHKEFVANERVMVSHSVKVGTTVKAGITGIVEASVTGEWGGTWTNEKTFTDKTTLDVKPGTYVYLISSVPMTRYTGTFTITVHNTTWTLPGVHFDMADPDGNDLMVWKEGQLTPEMIGTLPSVGDAPTVISSTYATD